MAKFAVRNQVHDHSVLIKNEIWQVDDMRQRISADADLLIRNLKDQASGGSVHDDHGSFFL